RSRRSPRSRGTSGTRGRASRRDRDLSTPPSVLRDRDELAERGLELLVRRTFDACAQHIEDLVLRTPVHEDDEAEAVPRLVLLVEARELREHLRVRVASL